MGPRAIWQFMDRDVTQKILYGPKQSWGPNTILWVTDWSMNYLLYYKKEFGENPEENIILTAPVQYTKILTGCANKDK